MPNKKRGFGSPLYDRERAREVQSMGSAAQAAAGKRFSFADDLKKAREAGRKGARARRRRKKP
jgi:general stress protein YciG